jgi:hypothetical protein
MNISRFSERHGLSPDFVPITIREDAPPDLRGMTVEFAYQAELRPSELRTIVCRVLMIPPNPSNWSEFPNIDGEIRSDLQSCPWYEVYDVIEAIHDGMKATDRYKRPIGQESPSEEFSRLLNQFFVRKGIGWQLVGGRIEVRGPEVFESAVRPTAARLEVSLPTAAQELHEALRDLARRPNADLTGAVHHSMAALECTARAAVADPKATLGAILAKHPGLIPPPLDAAVEKAWGFASEMGRHIREGRPLAYEEAELIVMFAAAAASYLELKIKKQCPT